LSQISDTLRTTRSVSNQGITLDHDLSIFNSPNDHNSGGNGFYNALQSSIKGTFSYLDKSGRLYLGGATTGHSFVSAHDTGGYRVYRRSS
jgi:hypothetical protein